MTASSALWSGVMKGSVNTPNCLTVPDQLIGAPQSTSMMPWRIAENSRV